MSHCSCLHVGCDRIIINSQITFESSSYSLNRKCTISYSGIFIILYVYFLTYFHENLLFLKSIIGCFSETACINWPGHAVSNTVVGVVVITLRCLGLLEAEMLQRCIYVTDALVVCVATN